MIPYAFETVDSFVPPFFLVDGSLSAFSFQQNPKN